MIGETFGTTFELADLLDIQTGDRTLHEVLVDRGREKLHDEYPGVNFSNFCVEFDQVELEDDQVHYFYTIQPF